MPCTYLFFIGYMINLYLFPFDKSILWQIKNQKIECDCGAIMKLGNYNKHINTNKHETKIKHTNIQMSSSS